ncbi:hypothetical protein ACHWQZ_G015504 [Mnemiopsis leidyi]
MKVFLTILALFAVSTAGPVSLTPQQELESISDFLATVRRIYEELVQRGSDFVCSAKLQELLDILGLPDKLDGAVELAQEWLCGEKEALMARPELRDVALQGFMDEVKRIYALAKAYGKDLVCGSSLHELLDLFGVDDRLDEAVKMVQGWLCGSADVVKRSTKADLVLEESFLDTIKRIYNELKAKGSEFVCSAKLNELLDLLGLDERLAPAVEYVQKKLCPEESGDLLQSTSHVEALEAYAIVWSDIWETLKSWSHDKLCTTKLQDLLDILGFPDALDGAVEMAQNGICGFFSVVKRSAEVDFALEASFIETVKRIYNQLKEYGSEFVCGAKIHELLDILGVDDRLDSAVKYVQDKLCGESEGDALVKRSAHSEALQAYGIVWSDIWETLKSWSRDKLCTTKLQDLLDILGFPDALDGAVEMAQNGICGFFSVVKRSAEVDFALEASFIETVKRIYNQLKEYGSEFVCGAKIHELLDILGVDDRLDSAVKYVQDKLCGESEGDALVKRSAHSEALQAYGIVWSDIWETLKSWSRDKLCTTKLQDLLDILGFPDALDGAVEMAQNGICGFFSVVKRSAEVDFALEASFIETVKRIYNQLKEYGLEFVCGAKIHELLDILGVDDRLDSAVKYVQDKLCGESEGDALVKRSAHSEALEAYAIVWSDIWETLKSWSHDKLCTTKLQDLLDILGFPDALDGAVEMAQNAICGFFSVEKREIKMTQVMHMQVVGGFQETVQAIYERLKTYFKGLVCSSKLQQLMDLLGVPDSLDGAVEMAQEMICGTVSLSSSLMVKHSDALGGFIDTVMGVLEKLYELGRSYVCNAGIADILNSLGLPDTMVWAVNIAVDWFCS